MYGLPDDFDPDVFLGRRLESVTFAVNVVVLGFSDQLTVSISGTVVYQESPDSGERREQPPAVQTSLIAAVGRAVETTELKSPRELVLWLEKGFRLVLLDDSDMYECYLISLGDREIVV